MQYEIALPTGTEKVSEDEIKQFIWVLYKMGYSIYRGFDNEICFTVTDKQVTELK
tara:strand:- start:236 stop:400 length:165 start_codon:yes stop_codon:yes gene_type:complete